MTYIKKYVTRNINFNYAKLVQLINKNFNVLVSKTTIYDVLAKKNITKKKIQKKQIFTEKTKRALQIKKFQKTIIDILDKLSINNIISIDESSIDIHISNNYGWSKSGKKITIIHEQQRKRYTLTTAITTKKIIHDEVMLGSATGKSFLKFMKNLINKLPQEETYYILMDNARIHHYHKIHKFIKRKYQDSL